ncbi:hypothetical protein LOC73_02075 [Mycolicibacterium mageritense]|nr:hypothetical protein [Mycolicibacterium mageritense]
MSSSSASSNLYRVTIARKYSLNRALAADQALPSCASPKARALSQSVKGAV